LANRIKILFGLLLILSACHSKTDVANDKFVEHDMSRATIDIDLPTALWDRIEAVYHSTYTKPAKEESKADASKGEAPKSDPADAILDEVTKEYVPLTVKLVEKTDNHGILQSHDHLLLFGPGGGVIDLADFVESRRGSYFLQIEFGKGKVESASTDADEAGAANRDYSKEPVKVFYLSNAKRRRLNGNVVGSGCNKYYDVSSFLSGAMKAKGLLLNTTEHLDVTALSGSFFFVSQINKTLYISQLSIKDSRFSQLQCRPMIGKIGSL
jgi:hypothetical protein